MRAEDRLLWHPVRLDKEGKLLSWVEGDAPYDKIVKTAWSAFKRVPIQPSGYRTYITFPTFYSGTDPNQQEFSGRGWCHNPAGLFAMLTDSAILYHAYSGDRVVLDRVRDMLDHQISHGSTEPTDAWASVPYSSSDADKPEYRGATEDRYQSQGGKNEQGRGDGVGFLEPDKVGELGLAYLQFYEVTLWPRYLQAALHCADALVKNVRKGDASHSPWPFRVDALTGKMVREPYTANTIGPIKLLDELSRLHRGNYKSYAATRDLAWNWLAAYPMKNNVWSQYFEDVLIYPDYRTNLNQYSPLETARYLLQHADQIPNARPKAKAILEWVTSYFAADSKTMAGLPEKGKQWGAEVISEQVNDMDKMSSHTARFASVLALWSEVTGDPGAKERAFRSFNWASYAERENGLVKTSIDEGTGYWFSDGYGDYMRHFLRGMASVPEWAPTNENHLLRSTSVVRSAFYGAYSMAYVTYDKSASEVVKLRRKPKWVRCGGKWCPSTAKPCPGGGWVVQVRHNGTDVQITY